MTRWLVSVPVWGERYVEVFCATALPALEIAMLRLGGDARLVVHTDQPKRIRDGATQIPVEVRPVPAGGRGFDCLSQAHREVLNMACMDDRVALLTADLVVSADALVECEYQFNEVGAFLIACAGIRAIEEGPVPIGASGHRLMKWAWKHRHPITTESTWPKGRANDLSRIYFEEGDSVVARLCLPHPIAVRIDGRPLRFSPTVDANLINNFHPAEIHMVRDSNRLALVELSPRDKDFQMGELTMEAKFLQNLIIFPDGIQRWAVRHKIVLIGEAVNCGDDDVIGAVLPVVENPNTDF